MDCVCLGRIPIRLQNRDHWTYSAVVMLKILPESTTAALQNVYILIIN